MSLLLCAPGVRSATAQDAQAQIDGRSNDQSAIARQHAAARRDLKAIEDDVILPLRRRGIITAEQGQILREPLALYHEQGSLQGAADALAALGDAAATDQRVARLQLDLAAVLGGPLLGQSKRWRLPRGAAYTCEVCGTRQRIAHRPLPVLEVAWGDFDAYARMARDDQPQDVKAREFGRFYLDLFTEQVVKLVVAGRCCGRREPKRCHHEQRQLGTGQWTHCERLARAGGLYCQTHAARGFCDSRRDYAPHAAGARARRAADIPRSSTVIAGLLGAPTDGLALGLAAQVEKYWKAQSEGLVVNRWVDVIGGGFLTGALGQAPTVDAS
jgi:hypothetical protein